MNKYFRHHHHHQAHLPDPLPTYPNLKMEMTNVELEEHELLPNARSSKRQSSEIRAKAKRSRKNFRKGIHDIVGIFTVKRRK